MPITPVAPIISTFSALKSNTIFATKVPTDTAVLEISVSVFIFFAQVIAPKKIWFNS